jgi:outer membrane protein assembly factor BamA
MKAAKQLTALILGACGIVSAQTASRADLIDSARTQKEVNLTPEQPPKGETVVEGIENSIPYRLMTGELDGFAIGVATILPGSALAVFPRYTRPDLFGGRLTLRINAAAATNESYIGAIGLSVPDLFGGHGFIDFNAVHRDISEMPYYGPGPNSTKTGRSDYRMEDTKVELRPGIQFFRHFRASLIGSYLANNVGPGDSSRYISSEQQFGPGAAPGIDRQTNFWRGGGLVEFDWRDQPDNPTKGGRYSAQYVRYLDRSLGAYSFLRLDLDASQYIPLFNQTHVVALHGASSLTSTSGSQIVPFYLQPTLGGPDTLRGYRFDRFYGDNSTLVSAEYRWDASPIVQMAAFADGGKVFNRWEQWNFHDLQSDVGFAIRFKGQSGVVTSFETAFSHEGFQIWFRMNNALQWRAQ